MTPAPPPSLPSDVDLDSLRLRLARLRADAEALARLDQGFPALWRGAERILAALRLMEINLDLEGRG